MLGTSEPIITQRINRWEIHAIELLMLPDELPRMVVVLAAGYEDGAALAWVRETRIEVPSESLVIAWSAETSGVSIYDAVKASLYSWLLAAGSIPAGATLLAEAGQRG